MNETSSIWILLAAMFGTVGLNFLFIRLYTLFSALSVRLYCKKEPSVSEQNTKGSAVFHNSMLTEIQKADKNVMLALYAALALLVFLWLFGQPQMHSEYLNMTVLLMRVAGGVCVFSEVSRIVAMLLLPAGLSCRDRVLSAMKTNIRSLLCIMLLYIAGLWLYSL